MPYINYVKSSKLADTFRLLSPFEVKTLGKWLNSPWCNSNKKVYELYLILKKSYPSFESKGLSKTEIFEKLYPKKKFNDRWLRNLMAELNKQIESFLVHQHLRNKKNNKEQMILAKEYEKRNASKRARKILNDIILEITTIPNKSTEDYLNLVQCHDMIYYAPHLHTDLKERGLILKNGNEFLDHFYLLHKWQYQAEITERKKVIKEDYKNQVDTQTLNKLNPKIQLPAISFYQDRVRSTVNKTTAEFIDSKNNFENTHHLLSTQDQKLIYFYLLNSGIRLSYKNNKVSFFKTIFNFYLLGIKNHYNTHFGTLSVATFGNIIVTGNNAKEFDLVLTFINDCHQLLSSEFRIEGKMYGTAHVNFHKGEYFSALNILSLAKFNSKNFLLRSRYLLSVTYFKIRQQDSSYISFAKDYNLAYIKFLKRSKAGSLSLIKSYLNSVKFIMAISDALDSPKPSVEIFKNIYEKIEENSLVAGKPWLLQESKEIILSFK